MRRVSLFSATRPDPPIVHGIETGIHVGSGAGRETRIAVAPDAQLAAVLALVLPGRPGIFTAMRDGHHAIDKLVRAGLIAVADARLLVGSIEWA
jgi:hypothetical protein